MSNIGVQGITATEVKGLAGKDHTELYRGAEYVVDFLPKIKLKIAVDDKLADQTVDTILSTASTGKIGDGKIFILDIQEAIRVALAKKEVRLFN